MNPQDPRGVSGTRGAVVVYIGILILAPRLTHPSLITYYCLLSRLRVSPYFIQTFNILGIRDNYSLP